MNEIIRLIGYDPGFGVNKDAEIVNGEMVTESLPSVVGVGSMDSGALGLTGILASPRRKTRQPHVVSFDGIEYLVGYNVAEYARPNERMDFNRFTDSVELRALMYATLARIVNGGSHRLALAIGLPVEVLQDASRATALERDMGAWIVGKHEFTIDGKPVCLEIVRMRVKEQPLCAWADWGFGLDGQWSKGKEALRAPVLVIDQGFNTLDIYAIEDLTVKVRYTAGENLGMRRAAEMIVRNLGQRYGIEMSLHEADTLVKHVIVGRKAVTYVDGSPVDVTQMVNQAVNSVSTDALNFIERKVGRAGKFKILVPGGGALAIGQRIVAQYPKAEIMPDPVLANARGLAKLAIRPGFLE